MAYQLKVIQPQGTFDGRNGRKVCEEMVKIMGSGVKTILIDFQYITFMDSSGFGTLLLTLKTVRQQQGRLVLCSINEQIKMILDLSDTTQAFEVFPNQASFMQEVTQHQT
ncbi:STAS domain-containing protein [Tolypothrix sp. PCC 7910]|uniref:STAS domain-containing protein n=1 Tax=Tolypothrix sp. PCC 7910 TaxID=2099387 RepID=UPI001427834E|nr:STAS domain-containing protein [Tolypothrix sp. PCC 7910]QIR40857.1 STAS domain-containing protein [Tolypothrix sp. PCC 7910]